MLEHFSIIYKYYWGLFSRHAHWKHEWIEFCIRKVKNDSTNVVIMPKIKILIFGEAQIKRLILHFFKVKSQDFSRWLEGGRGRQPLGLFQG